MRAGSMSKAIEFSFCTSGNHLSITLLRLRKSGAIAFPAWNALFRSDLQAVGTNRLLCMIAPTMPAWVKKSFGGGWDRIVHVELFRPQIAAKRGERNAVFRGGFFGRLI